MEKVICPNCNKKLETIDKKELSITFEKGVEPQQPNVSMGMLIAPFKCPKCGKTNIQTIAI